MTEQEFTEKLLKKIKEYTDLRFENYYNQTIADIKNNAILENFKIKENESFKVYKKTLTDKITQSRIAEILNNIDNIIIDEKELLEVSKRNLTRAGGN